MLSCVRDLPVLMQSVAIMLSCLYPFCRYDATGHAIFHQNLASLPQLDHAIPHCLCIIADAVRSHHIVVNIQSQRSWMCSSQSGNRNASCILVDTHVYTYKGEYQSLKYACFLGCCSRTKYLFR